MIRSVNLWWNMVFSISNIAVITVYKMVLKKGSTSNVGVGVLAPIP